MPTTLEGATPFPYFSQRNILFECRGDNVFSDLITLDSQSAALLTGAPDDSKIIATFEEKKAFDKYAPKSFGYMCRKKCIFEIENATFFESPAVYELRLNWDNNMVLIIDMVLIRSELQGRGITREMLRRSVEAAYKIGVSKIGLVAAYLQSDKKTPMRGPQTWPRYGFCGGIFLQDQVRKAIDAGFPTDIRDLPKGSTGLAWHIEQLHTFFLTFEVSPESENWHIFDSYLRQNAGGIGLNPPPKRPL